MTSLQRRGFLADTTLALLAAASAVSKIAPAASLAAADSASAKAPAASPEIETGGVRLIEVDGKYHVRTKRLGKGRIKLLTLHGGPGGTHEYFKCFEDFLPDAGVEFYYYDQLGLAYSDQPDDTSLWTLPRFVEEVEQVRKGLGLDDF